MPTILELNKKNIIEVLLNNRLSIPVYQRSYAWSEQNVEALLSDISLRSSDGSEHFFGTLAFANEGGGNVLRVIDGQQRLTTTLLIYSKLLNHVHEQQNVSKKSIYAEKIKRLQRVNFSHELNETDLDNNLRLIQEGKYDELSDNFEKNHKVIENYCKDKKTWEIEENIKTLEECFSVGMVFFTIDRKNEMLVFETLNARGTPLANFDLIRNHLISLCTDPGDNSPQDGVYARNLRWFNTYIYNKELWKANGIEITDEKLATKLDDFFAEYIAYKRTALKTPIEKIGQYKIFRNLKKIIDKMSVVEWPDYQEMIFDMRSMLDLYIRLEKQRKRPDNVWLGVLGQKSAHYPLVFGLYKKFAVYNKKTREWSEPEELQQYFKLMAYYILKLLSVKGTGQSLQDLWLEVLGYVERNWSASEIYTQLSNNKRSSTYEIPTDAEFAKALLSRPTQTGLPKSLILVLGQIAYEKAGMGEPWAPKNISVEHIMPQDPTPEKWPNVRPGDEDFNQCLNQIGNLTIIDLKKNSGMGNSPFEAKKAEYAKSDSPLLTGRNLGLKPITEYNEFGYEQIKERTRMLTKVLIDYFKQELNA